jgi:hypothetical protein
MNKNSLKFSIVLSFLVLFLCTSWAGAGEPKVVALELKFDLGKVPANSKVSHEFWVKNGGTDTLRIVTVSVP